MSKKDVVCGCKHVTKADIEAAVAAGATTYEEVRRQTGAGSKCGKCKKRVQKAIAKAVERRQKAAKKDAEAKEHTIAQDAAAASSVQEAAAQKPTAAQGESTAKKPEAAKADVAKSEATKSETATVEASAAAQEKSPFAPRKLRKPAPSHLTPAPAASSAPATPEAATSTAATSASKAAPALPFNAVSAESPLASASGRTLQIHGIYRHFKGDCYLVEDVARNSENGEEYVVYRKLYGDGSLWIRPKKMFLSPVDRQKYPDVTQKWRFELQRVSSVAR